jgi:hypothetical protein
MIWVFSSHLWPDFFVGRADSFSDQRGDEQGEAVPFNGTCLSFSSLENRFDNLEAQFIG